MCVCVRVISRKPWPVRVRVRVTQGLSLSNSPGVIETNGLSSLIILGQHKGQTFEALIQPLTTFKVVKGCQNQLSCNGVEVLHLLNVCWSLNK